MTDLNSTSAALLGLLFDGAATGGELVAKAGTRYGSFFSVTRSQVYRELPALADAGLVRLGKQGARSSQQYVITPAGKRSLRKWVNADSGEDHVRSTLLLRTVNSSRLTTKQRAALIEAAREHYTAAADAARNAAKELEGIDKAVEQFAQAHAKAALKLIDAVENEEPADG